MSSSMEEETIIRSGWVEKKSMKTYLKSVYMRRYLVLTKTRLYYLSTEPTGQSRENINFEVNLELINKVLDRDYCDNGLGKFDVVTPSRHLTIKCNFDEKLLWIRDIENARTVGNGKTSIYNNVPTATNSPGVSKRLKKMLLPTPAEKCNGQSFTSAQSRALRELYDFMCSSTDLCASIVHSVFQAVNALSGPEKNRISKLLGQVLAMWLGENDNHLENCRRASRLSVSTCEGKPSQLDILTVWLEISLVREFRDSCSHAQEWSYAPRWDDENHDSKDKDDSGVPPAENEKSNIPFRRDNVESLFILSFIKSVAQNTGMLSTWLMPSLIVISQNPENVTNSIVSIPIDSLETRVEGEKSAESISHCRSVGVDEIGEKVSISGDHLSEVPTRDASPEDVIHTESRRIIDKMSKSEEFIPPSFKLLIGTIYRLTVDTSDVSTNVKYEDGSATEGGFATEIQPKRQYESKSAYGIYYSSSCATLFLRLICPALLNPLEWGVLSQRTLTNPIKKSSVSAQPHVVEKGRKRKMIKRFFIGKLKMNEDMEETASRGVQEDQLDYISDMNRNPAAAAVILVAHILNSCELNECWTSNDSDLDNFLQIRDTVVRLIPIEKLDFFVKSYERGVQSVVDSTTRKVFESIPVKKSLMNLAKDIQRLANLSVSPSPTMEGQAKNVYSRMNAIHDDCAENSPDMEKEVQFQVEQAKNIQKLYNILGRSSNYLSFEVE